MVKQLTKTVSNLDIETARVENELPRDMPVGDDLPLKFYEQLISEEPKKG